MKGDEEMKKFETAEKLLNEQLQLLAQKSKECRPEDLADITLAMLKVFESLCRHERDEEMKKFDTAMKI